MPIKATVIGRVCLQVELVVQNTMFGLNYDVLRDQYLVVYDVGGGSEDSNTFLTRDGLRFVRRKA